MRKYVIVPEPLNIDAQSGKRLRPGFVLLLRRLMLATIKFDGELQFVTVEVENVAIPACLHRMLPAKLGAAESTVTQQRPDKLFGVCLFTSQFASEIEEIGGQRWLVYGFSLTLRSLTPPPLCSAPSVPLSQRERGPGSRVRRQRSPL